MVAANRNVRWLAGVVLIGWSGLAAAANSTPDISGTWNRYPDPGADPFAPEPPPPGGLPPLKEPYATAYKKLLARQQEADARGKPLATASSRCLPEGMPTMMGAHYALELLQTRGRLTIVAEFMSEVRRVYLDEAMPSLDDINPTYTGYSVGKWRGNTLEVETLGVRTDVQYLDFPHTAKMKILEKIHLTAANLLEDEITVIDPDVLTRPYTFAFGYKKEDPSYRITEYVCDNNHVAVGQDGSFGMKVEPQRSADQSK